MRIGMLLVGIVPIVVALTAIGVSVWLAVTPPPPGKDGDGLDEIQHDDW